MILAKVLVGFYTLGDPTLRRPPPRNDPDDPHALFDSCVNLIFNPDQFIIFENSQLYPQYVIRYVHQQTQ